MFGCVWGTKTVILLSNFCFILKYILDNRFCINKRSSKIGFYYSHHYFHDDAIDCRKPHTWNRFCKSIPIYTMQDIFFIIFCLGNCMVVWARAWPTTRAIALPGPTGKTMQKIHPSWSRLNLNAKSFNMKRKQTHDQVLYQICPDNKIATSHSVCTPHIRTTLMILTWRDHQWREVFEQPFVHAQPRHA